VTSTASWKAIVVARIPVDSVTCARASLTPSCGRIAAAIVQCVVDWASSAA
jgi:hypothetical protein